MWIIPWHNNALKQVLFLKSQDLGAINRCQTLEAINFLFASSIIIFNSNLPVRLLLSFVSLKIVFIKNVVCV